MNADQLLRHFDRISDAADAVPQIRQLILQLAVRGKLVHQEPTDDPATEFLENRALSLNPSEQPWQLPLGWEWSSLRMLGESIGGGTPSKANADFWRGSVPWVSPKDMKVDRIADAEDHISEDAIANSAVRLIPAGALLLVVRGMILARSFPTALSAVPVTINQDMKAVVPFRKDIAEILLLITKGMKSEVLRLVQRATHGTCRLLTNDLFSVPLPIPPLTEQHRIVAKVDALMALCDQLEAAQAERERRRDRIVAASLQRLNQPTDDAERFRRDAGFHLHHLARSTTRPEHTQQLRQTILNLAVRGQLVCQDPNDEPAPAFERVAGSETPPIELPTPTGWSWTRVHDVAECRLGKMLDAAKNSGDKYRYLRNTNIQWFEIRTNDLKTLRLERVEVEKYALRKGDVLICEGGHGIGRTAVWREEDPDVVFQKALHRVRPGPALTSDFFAYCMFVYFHSNVLQRYFTGVGIPHFTGKALSMVVFPLPPLAEQHRIVAKVDQLMAVCDGLEAQLSKAQVARSRLLEAVLHDALNSTRAPTEAPA